MNYIGSKFSILSFIEGTIEQFVKPKNNKLIFCDIFSGTATVGKYFKRKGYSILANDIQYFSYITTKHFIENNKELTFDGLDINPFDYLNSIDGVEGFIYSNYAPSGTEGKEFERLYFTDYNAKKIDAIRNQIEVWKTDKKITDNEYNYLITCLVEAADKVANTASVYEAFLKKMKQSAQKGIELKPLEVIIGDSSNTYKVYNEDCNQLIEKISGDILYLDPPYNSRKYDTNYHMLETIALYDNPEIKGKTGTRTEQTKKSRYCNKKEAVMAFEDLIKKAKFKYILLSYNDEGIMSMEEIRKIMSKYGHYKCFAKEHKRYKSDRAREYIKDFTIEYIHCLEKED